jgi:hypothetical protein
LAAEQRKYPEMASECSGKVCLVPPIENFVLFVVKTILVERRIKDQLDLEHEDFQS